GHGLHRAFGILDVEEVFADAIRLDPPQHGEIDVNDVLVAGEHQAFFRHVAHGGAAAQIVDDAHADVDLADLQGLGRQRGLNRIGQMVVEARLDFTDLLAEAQHDADLVRLDAEEPGHAPQHDRAERDQGEAAAAHVAAGQGAPELVLAAAQQILEIRRRRPGRLRSGTPGALRSAARSPGPAALIAPWHESSPRRPAICRRFRCPIRVIWEPSAPYNARPREDATCWPDTPFPLL